MTKEQANTLTPGQIVYVTFGRNERNNDVKNLKNAVYHPVVFRQIEFGDVKTSHPRHPGEDQIGVLSSYERVEIEAPAKVVIPPPFVPGPVFGGAFADPAIVR